MICVDLVLLMAVGMAVLKDLMGSGVSLAEGVLVELVECLYYLVCPQ